MNQLTRTGVLWCCVLLVIVASACSRRTPTAPSPSATPTPAPTPVIHPSVLISVVSPTGFDLLNLMAVNEAGVWDNSNQTRLLPAVLTTTTVNYTTRLSEGTYGIGFNPLKSNSSGSSFNFGGGVVEGNTGGVQPDSIRVIYVQHDPQHITVNRCSVIVPSDVGEIDVTFVIIRADVTQVC